MGGSTTAAGLQVQRFFAAVIVIAIAHAVGACRASRSASTPSDVVSGSARGDASDLVVDDDAQHPSVGTEFDEAVDEGALLEERPAWTAALVLDHASHPSKGGPTAVVHAPSGYDPAPPIQLVVYLHGWSGCAAVLEGTGLVACRPDDPSDRRMEGWGLGERHDAATTNTLFVVPQLSFLDRDGTPGRFSEDGFFGRFLDELLGEGLADRLGGPRAVGDVDHVTLVAHSAGFQTALAITQRGSADDLVREVVLFDALYAAPAVFAQWVSSPPEGRQRKIVSLYTAKGRTYQNSLLLAQHLRGSLGFDQVALDPEGPLVEAIRAHRAVIARSPVGHGSVPARHLAEVIGAFDLRRRDVE